MKIVTLDGKTYRLPNGLNPFQQELYIHMIDWKRMNITTGVGTYLGYEYDAILPDRFKHDETSPSIYPGVAEFLKAHRKQNPFRFHKHFNHMASSQAANINLFLPILSHPKANSILSLVKADFSSLATDKLDKGYCIEFWGGNFDDGKTDSTGPLGDKSKQAGTDADIAIAYYNHDGDPCLWLIEHKLSEKEFTTCGGFRSEQRQKENYDCEQSFADILRKKDWCYYHGKKKYRYWSITQEHEAFFANHGGYASCPFKGGMNQLWRNQLLALALEHDEAQPYRKVFFSVVRHPKNTSLDETMKSYRDLIGNDERFSDFTSKDLLDAVEKHADQFLESWMKWYKSLYKIP